LIAGLDHLPPQRLRDVLDRSATKSPTATSSASWTPAAIAIASTATPVVDGGRTLTFEQAMERFTDSAGRPVPATWESGTFLEGQDDLPVTG
jgi:hypothetical protein